MENNSLDEYYRLFFQANSLYEKFAKVCGTNLQHLFLMRLLSESPSGLCQRDICSSLGVPKQTMSRILKRAVTDGLLEVRVSKSDRREKLYALTPLGQNHAKKLTAKLSAVENASLVKAGGGLAQANKFNKRYLNAFEDQINSLKKGN